MLALLVPALASADADITVDGLTGDWASTITCYPEVSGDSRGQIDLNRACLENNNAAGDQGSLFLLLESVDPWPSQNQNITYGFGMDLNNNGTMDANDRFFAVVFDRGNPAPPDPVRMELWMNNRLVGTYLPGQGCGGTPTSNGWSARRGARTLEVAIAYGCIGLGFGTDIFMVSAGTSPFWDETAPMYYDGTTGSLAPPAPPPDVALLTARALPGQVSLHWNNPAQHEGVLILRAAGAPPNTAPVRHQQYAVGATLGNATVVYSDRFSTASQFSNSGLVNGTRYYYRVYNHHQNYTYAPGDSPPGGIWAEPKARAGGNPLWCYSTGFPNTVQPVTDLGVAVYSAGNLGAITANRTDTATVTADGAEKFRPVGLGAPIGNRFALGPLAGHGGSFIVTGDQSGRLWAVNANTGAILWQGNGGAPLGDRIQGQPIIQRAARANAAYQALHAGRDLIFIGTRNAVAGSNKVYALSSVDGQVVWTYAPGDLEMINGGFMIDYEFNRLWVAARGAGSLRVLDSLTGTPVPAPLTSRFDLGDIDTGVVRDQGFTSATSDDSAVVVTTGGTVYAIDTTNLVQRWSVAVGPTSTFVTPTGSGFIASVSSGSVQRWLVINGTPSMLWSASVPTPSGVRIDFAGQKVFVGGSDGRLYELDVVSGAARSFPVSPGQAVGTPTIDPTAGVNRLHVGSLDGRLCAFQLPFP
jgi:outer membrane protein assembly factor BamB